MSRHAHRQANGRRSGLPLPRTARHATLALTGLLAMGLAQAADTPPPIKPGLWEMTSESQQLNGKPVPDQSAQMAAQLKNMPPEMRKQIEAQMKAQGIQINPAGTGGGMAARMCLTKDMLAQNRWQQSEGDCKSQVTSRSGSTWKWTLACTKPPAQGEGSTTFANPENYSGEVRMTTQEGGKPQVMTMKHRARWISADCGGLKPPQTAKR